MHADAEHMHAPGMARGVHVGSAPVVRRRMHDRRGLTTQRGYLQSSPAAQRVRGGQEAAGRAERRPHRGLLAFHQDFFA